MRLRANGPRPELTPLCRRNHSRAGIGRRHCDVCRARDNSVKELRRWEIANGIYGNGLLDAAPVRDHMLNLLSHGWTYLTISAAVGVNYKNVRIIVARQRQKLTKPTYDAIMSLQPKPYADVASRGRICAVGVARKVQGLMAQGWSSAYMAEICGVHRSRLSELARMKNCFVKQDTIDVINVLVDKLRPYDIADLDQPMPGMSTITADRAHRTGWRVLADWDGLDIDDPRVAPFAADERPAPINPTTVAFALAFEPVRTFDEVGQHQQVYVEPFAGRVTRAEAHEIVRRGSRPVGNSGEPRFSIRVLADRLGLHEQMILRMRTANRTVDAVVADAPPLIVTAHLASAVLTDTEFPPEFRLSVARRLLGRYPLGFGFTSRLTILRLTAPAPLGLGWSDDQVADWLGCTTADAAALRARAELAGSQLQEPLPARSSQPAPLTDTHQLAA